MGKQAAVWKGDIVTNRHVSRQFGLVILSLTIWTVSVTDALAFARGHEPDYPLPQPQIKNFREKNRIHIGGLKAGMSLDEVQTIMGTDQNVQTYYILKKEENLLSNPHRRENRLKDGKQYLVLYYYTDLIRKDGQITDDELTPVMLESGKVVCVGWEPCKEWSHVLSPPGTSGKNE